MAWNLSSCDIGFVGRCTKRGGGGTGEGGDSKVSPTKVIFSGASGRTRGNKEETINSDYRGPQIRLCVCYNPNQITGRVWALAVENRHVVS